MEQTQGIRIPPHSIEAEQSVLGSIIMDHEAAIVASEILRPSDFYRPDHKEIFGAMMELYAANIPIDLITLQEKLVEKGVLEQVGGISYLAELATIVPTSAHIKQYAKIVEEKAVLRRLIKTSNDIVSKAYEGENVQGVMSFAEKQIFDIVQNRRTEDFTHVNEVLIDSIDKLEFAHKNKGGITGVPTGFIDLDYKTAGLQPSDLILVAARPSMGKTAFALNIVQTAGIKYNKKVAMFSLEMSKEQLVSRMLCAEAMVDSQKARTGALEKEDWDRLARAIPNIARADIYIDDTPSISPMEIRAKCRRLKLEKGLDLIMIDYLQLMSSDGAKSDSRQQEISEISRALKALAREMEAPVIALSQLSRACEARADHRPMLSDLRESGAIEQDADVVMFLYRDEYYNPDTDKKNIGEVIIAKQRNGPTGTVELVWLGQYTKFANLQR